MPWPVPSTCRRGGSTKSSSASAPSPPTPIARHFGMSEGYFLGLQTDYDLRAKKREIAKELAAIAVREAAE